MKTYKFTDQTNSALHIIDSDGISRQSCSVNNPEYQAWLADGNTPEPFDTPTLAESKAALRTKVNDKRNWYEVSGFPYMGKVFDSDPRSFYRITTANDAALKDPSFSIEWTVADNTKLAMNANQMLGVMPALAGYGQLIFNNSVALKEAIEAAESVEELQDIDIDSGWPVLADFLQAA
jgi:hypothetical protein